MRWRHWPLLFAVVLVLVFCAGRSLCAQSAPTGPKPAAISAATFDPTKPEAQPNLSHDQDPVLSPDSQDNLPATPDTTVYTIKPGQIERQQSGVYTLREDVDEVQLNCTVVDHDGRLVNDLNRGDFQVWEDNVPQTITSFRHQDLPVSIGILIDNSGSMRYKRAAVNAAALELVRTSNQNDAAFIVNFSDHAYLDQDLTSNIHDLERGLTRVDSKGSTALYDAVVASADELSEHAKQPKQVVLIVTDGEDNASRLTREQAISRVQNLGGPVVYTVGLLFDDVNKQKSLRARQALETLSADTGGIAYFPRSLNDVNQIADQVARDIRNQYTIGYHSSKPPSLGGYRTVNVEAMGPKHHRLIVRTRTGYYPGQSQSQLPVQTAQKKQ
jgi:VWFA-related protein